MSTKLRLYLIGAAILLAGLLGAVAIYATASDERSDTLGYEIVDGVAYPIVAHDSKRYRHDLERFGGKAAVLADDFNRWFAGLWIGKGLANTVATLAAGVALGFFRAAQRLSGRRPRGQDLER